MAAPPETARTGPAPNGTTPNGTTPSGPALRDPDVDIDADAVAGLDALDTPTELRTPLWQRVLRSAVPPLLTLVAVIALWQALWASAVFPEFKVPAPLAVAEQFGEIVADGSIWSITWTSVGRALVGFAVAVLIGTPLGLLVAKVTFVRRAIGPLLSGMQSLPSVAWVPAAVLWFGLTDATIYFVVLLGSVPSIANGLVSGIDQVPPILGRVGDVMGAGRLASARLILLPAALPGYLSGCKQGWAFAWRSLMAAEIIATSPQLGIGLGAYLKAGSDVNNIAGVISAIALILLVGVGIELLGFKPLERRVLRTRGLAAGV